MRDKDLFGLALALEAPWFVVGSTFEASARQLDIELDFARGSRFACLDCKASGCAAYDSAEMTWRHLNFFQHDAYLTARVPRVSCEICGIRRVSVPWARDGSGFTLLFEALIMALVSTMPVAAVARLVGEHDTRLWRLLHRYFEEALGRADHSGVTRVAFDETSARCGHDHVTLFVDLDGPRVLFVADGKDAATVESFATDFAGHGGTVDDVTEVCIDMSPAFIKGTTDHLPAAEITFDKFHAVKIVNDAVDKVRRAEQKDRPELKKTRYMWLRNKVNLSKGQLEDLGRLSKRNLKTARAYQIKPTFQELYEQLNPEAAKAFLKNGISGERTHASRRSSRPPKPSNGTRQAYCDGSTPASQTVSSRASTASFRPQKPRPADTDHIEISRPSSTSSPASSISAYHSKQRGISKMRGILIA